MSCPKPSRTNPGPEENPSVANAAESLLLTVDQLARWAELIARREAEFPSGLESSQEKVLQQQVQRRLRQRLVQFIARQIAYDIERSRRDN